MAAIYTYILIHLYLSHTYTTHNPHLGWQKWEHTIFVNFNSITLTLFHRLLPNFFILSWLSVVWSLRDREVVCSASDRQGSNFCFFLINIKYVNI